MQHNWTLAELRAKTDDEIVVQFDEDVRKYMGEASRLPVQFYLQELQRRDSDRSTAAMLKYTRWITLMTLITTIATLANLWVVLRPSELIQPSTAIQSAQPTSASGAK